MPPLTSKSYSEVVSFISLTISVLSILCIYLIKELFPNFYYSFEIHKEFQLMLIVMLFVCSTYLRWEAFKNKIAKNYSDKRVKG